MLKRRRPLVLLAALAIAGLAASGCGSSAAAVRVDDAYISQSDFQDQLDAILEKDALRTVLFGQPIPAEQLRGEGAPAGAVSQQFAGSIAGAQVQFMVIAEVLDDEGLEVTETDRDALVAELEAQAAEIGLDVTGAFDDLPDGMREQYLDALAGREILRSQLGGDFETAVNEAYGTSDIVISSRYGAWDPDQGAVVPPSGPATAPGADIEGLSVE